MRIGGESVNLFDLVVTIGADTSKAENTVNGLGGKLQSGLSKAAKVGAAAIGAATGAVTAFAASAVSVGSNFDSAMSQVAATMGVTTEEVGDLRDFAQEMGSSTAFSATQAAEALNYMALAGYTSEESMEALPNVLNLAAAGGIDLAEASDMVTDAQSALGLTMEETTELVDKMAKASSKSNTSVAQLGSAILTVGGTAKNLAGGTTELSTALGILADNGVKGAEGGTALRNIILSLSAPTDTAAGALKELGVNAFDSNGNLRSLNDVFTDFNNSLANATQEERTQYINKIFNKTDIKSVEALLANTGDRWNELTGYINDAQGAAQAMADTQLDNLQGDITLLQSAFEGAQIAISDKLTPSLREFVQFANTSVSDMTVALKEGGLDGLINSFGDAFSSGLQMIVSKLPEAISVGMQVLGAVAQGIVENLPVLAESAIEIVGILFDGIMQALPEVATAASELMSKFGEYIKENLPTLMQSGLESAVAFTSSLRDNAGKVIDGAIELAKNLAQGLADSIPTIVENVPTIVSNIANVINDNAPKLLFAAANIIATLVKGLLAAIPTIIQNMPKIIGAIWDTITAVNWINLGGTIVKGIGNGIKSMVNFAKESINSIKNSMKEGISTLPATFRDIGRNMIQGLINGIKSLASSAVQNVKGLGTSLVSGVKSVLGIHSPSRVFSQIGEFMVLGLEQGWDDKFSSVKNGIVDSMDFGTAQIGVESSVYTKSQNALAGMQNFGNDINIVVQSVLDGKVIGETAYKYNRQLQRSMGV